MDTNYQYSECPLVIKHFVPNSFNLQMQDYNLKENPQITLKKVPPNPFKNIKLAQSNLVEQPTFKIIFKNKTNQKYKPRAQIRPSKIFKVIKKSLVSEKQMEDKLFQQQFHQIEKEDSELCQSRVLNAKLFQHAAIQYRLSLNNFHHNDKQNSQKNSFRKRLSMKHVQLGTAKTTNFSQYKSVGKTKKTMHSELREQKTRQQKRNNTEKRSRKNSPAKNPESGLFMTRSKTLGTLLKKQIQQMTQSSFNQQKNLKLDLNIKGSRAPYSQTLDHWKKALLQNCSKRSLKLPNF